MSSLNDLSRFGPNEINMFLVDPVTKELSRVRSVPGLVLAISLLLLRFLFAHS